MQVIKHVIIAAAGMGSRLGLGRPKCLLELNSQSLLEHQLDIVSEIEDIRIIVGFEEELVIKKIKNIRSDVLICRNSAYRVTSTADSYAKGSRYLKDWCLFMDADIIFDRESFRDFCASCVQGVPLIAVTRSKTDDAVFTSLDDNNKIINFSRAEKSDFEWANLAWLPPDYFEKYDGPVFEKLAIDLPLSAKEIVSFEIDTQEDLDRAKRFISANGL